MTAKRKAPRKIYYTTHLLTFYRCCSHFVIINMFSSYLNEIDVFDVCLFTLIYFSHRRFFLFSCCVWCVFLSFLVCIQTFDRLAVWFSHTFFIMSIFCWVSRQNRNNTQLFVQKQRRRRRRQTTMRAKKMHVLFRSIIISTSMCFAYEFWKKKLCERTRQSIAMAWFLFTNTSCNASISTRWCCDFFSTPKKNQKYVLNLTFIDTRSIDFFYAVVFLADQHRRQHVQHLLFFSRIHTHTF